MIGCEDMCGDRLCKQMDCKINKQGLVPAEHKEAICKVKATCRRLIRARINDCHRRINYANDKLLLCLSKLKELIPTPLLDNLTTIADKRAKKTTEQHHAIVQSNLTRLQHAAHKKGHKTDKNWVRNISSRPSDENETQVLSYGLKHSVTPKRILTDDIVSSVESVLARQRELPESTKADIRSRIASTLQSDSLTDCNLTKDELNALRRLRNDKDIVILPADKGRVTVVMDKKDCTDKMDSLVNDNQTYEPLKRNHKPTLQRRLNGKLLDLKKTETTDIQLHYRLRCRVPQSAKLYGLPKLHKPNIPMQPIVSFCGSPTYQLSKHLTNILKVTTQTTIHGQLH